MITILFLIIWSSIGINWTINILPFLERMAEKNCKEHGYNYTPLMTWYWISNVVIWPLSMMAKYLSRFVRHNDTYST